MIKEKLDISHSERILCTAYWEVVVLFLLTTYLETILSLLSFFSKWEAVEFFCSIFTYFVRWFCSVISQNAKRDVETKQPFLSSCISNILTWWATMPKSLARKIKHLHERSE